MLSSPPHQPVRETWLDALRLMAGLSMVGLHASADPNGQPFPDVSSAERVAPMLLRSVLYIARTELFLLISVFILLMAVSQRPRSYATVISQQSSRLLPPFLFWTGFYACFNLFKATSFGYLQEAVAVLTNPINWPGLLLLGSVKYHMHFIPTLFGLLLMYPLFRVAYRWPIVGLSIIGFLALKWELDATIYKTFWDQAALPYVLRLAKILTYAGYGMAAASMLGLYQRTSPKQRAEWTGAVALGMVLLFSLKLFSAAFVIESGSWAFDYQPGYWADFLMPVLLMLLCLSLSNLKWPAFLSTMAKYSFGIYLCHPIFLDAAEIMLREVEAAPIHMIFMKLLPTLAGTCLLVWQLSKSRYLSWTIGLSPPSARHRSKSVSSQQKEPLHAQPH